MNQDINQEIKSKIFEIISKIFDIELFDEKFLKQFTIEKPPEKISEMDLSLNVSMILAGVLKKNPFEIAEKIANELKNTDFINEIEIKRPGFINFNLSNYYLKKILINSNSEDYGFERFNSKNKGEKINIEYVSANPTGPLHVGHIRCAIYGETISNLLQKAGFDVRREYYVNDGGVQIEKLLNSFLIRCKEILQNVKIEESIEYSGEYLIDIARETLNLNSEISNLIKKESLNEQERGEVKKYLVQKILGIIKRDLEKIDVKHDIFTHESDIIISGKLDAAFKKLQDEDMIYKGFVDDNGYNKKIKRDENREKEEHFLLRTTKFGDESDRVFKKSNGDWAYISPDIAYHKDKFDRGFQKMLLILGSDHKGQVDKIKIGTACVTNNEADLDVKLFEQVNYLNEGKRIKMSKRSGNFLTLEDILETGIDKNILKFILLSKKPTTVIDFDVSKLKEQTKENPVFYVQYAHCRLHNMIEKSEVDCKTFEALDTEKLNEIDLSNKYIRLMILKLNELPSLIKKATLEKEPNLIISYLIDLSSIFHSSWNGDKIENRIKYIDENKNKTYYNMYVCFILKKTIKKCLNILGIEEIYYL